MKTKSASMGWSSFLIALALAFVVVLSPLFDWIHVALGLPANKFIEAEFALLAFVFWMALRAWKSWRALPESQRPGAATAFVSSQLARFFTFSFVMGAGVWSLYLLFGNIFQNAELWGIMVADLLVFVFLFRAATWAADAVSDPIWRNARVEKMRVPDGAAFVELKQTFVVGEARFDFRFWVAILAALGAVCLLVYASLMLAVRAASVAAPAPTWAIIGFVLLLCALRLWWECVPLARVDAAEIRPRFGRAFRWFDIGQIEESRVTKFMEGDERRLIFLDKQGVILWQLPLDGLEREDQRELRRLFPRAEQVKT